LTESLINRYERASSKEGWGWLEEPLSESWQTFQQRCIAEACEVVGGLLSGDDHSMVKQITESVHGSVSPQAYLLHGDCGVHNFIFDSSFLRGVIDPTPMIGPPLYDFIFAFCSSPDELTIDTLFEAVRSLKPFLLQHATRRILIEEVLVQLYCRIATCLKYHSHHLPEYLEAWNYWRNIRDEVIA
jgi:fructosamine-3-kinase